MSPKRLKEGTRIEILQLPLNSSLQPTTDLSTSQGRFIALRKEFLDPATVPPGTFVTITGDIGGSLSLPLDETEYTYPLVQIKNLRVWTNHEEDEAPRIRRPIGPGPYWGPYWSPYWYPLAVLLVRQCLEIEEGKQGRGAKPPSFTEDKTSIGGVIRCHPSCRTVPPTALIPLRSFE